jgi:hypothetical protein
MTGRVRRLTRAVGMATVLVVAMSPMLVRAAPPPQATEAPERSADLDGKPIALKDVGKWYCQDFEHPTIHCFTNPAALEADVSGALRVASATAVTYVVVYDYTLYQGGYMYMSDDYQALSVIGWNDRISSISVRNSMSGKFWTDWFYTGTGYYFCCNSQVSYLGNFDNTFSSVFHY